MNKIFANISTALFIAGAKLRREEKGATAVEYGIMVSLIAVVIIGAVFAIGGALKTDFNAVATCIGTPAAAGCP